jgi:hypothetical protein
MGAPAPPYGVQQLLTLNSVEVTMDDFNGLSEDVKLTARELVLTHRPTARVESRPNPRTNKPQCRVVCLPGAGQRRDLGPWCGSEDRAWEAACLRLGLRLRRRV